MLHNTNVTITCSTPLPPSTKHFNPVHDLEYDHRDRNNVLACIDEDTLGKGPLGCHYHLRHRPLPLRTLEGLDGSDHLTILDMLDDEVRDDDGEEEKDAEEEPHVDHFDVGGWWKGIGRIVEESVEHQQRGQTHDQTHLREEEDVHASVT